MGSKNGLIVPTLKMAFFIGKGEIKMPRRGENIRKRKDGRWEGRFKKENVVSEKTVYGSVYGHTYREVKEKLKVSVFFLYTRHRAGPEL